MGDLPVPPTERLPTQISGKPKEVDLKIFFIIQPVADGDDQPVQQCKRK